MHTIILIERTKSRKKDNKITLPSNVSFNNTLYDNADDAAITSGMTKNMVK